MIHALDLRYAARQLRRTPALTLAAALTLAIAIGGNTAVVGLARAVLLRPPPFAEPDRLVLVWGEEPGATHPRLPLSHPNFADLREGLRGTARLAAWSALDDYRSALTGGGAPVEVRYAVASVELFALLGVDAAAGRTFALDDERAAAGREVLVSHRLWSSRWGGDPTLVGRAIQVDGEPYEVVGVLPAGFRFANREADLWFPLLLDPAGSGPRSRMYARGAKYLGVVGRLAEGVSLDRAQDEVDGLARRLAAEHAYFNTGLRLDVVALAEPAMAARRPTLLLLLGAVGLVLLIGCANVANLLAVRAAERRRELAMRWALGAGRSRLARQLLLESLLLAVLGGAAGVAVAAGALRLLPLLPGGEESLFLPYAVAADEVRIDLPALAVAVALTGLVTLLCGLVPALRAGRVAVPPAWMGRGPVTPRRERRAVEAIVALQLALSLMLLTGAGLLVRSLAALHAVELGFDPAGVLVADLRLPPARHGNPGSIRRFHGELLARLSALPGATGAGLIEQRPLSGPPQSTDVRLEGAPDPAPGEELLVHQVGVSPGLRQALGVPLLRGRELTDADREGSSPVALVSETLARRAWPGQDPIGKRVALSVEALRFRPDGPPTLDFASAYRTVVGVVADVRQEGAGSDPLPELWIPLAQRPVEAVTLVLRTAGEPLALARAAEAAVAAVDPEQPLGRPRALADVVAESLGAPRSRAQLFSLLSAIALLLAAVGLYGALAHTVATQRREHGLRMALGARPRQILALVAWRAGSVLLVGGALGLLAGVLLRRAVAGLLFGLTPSDPRALAAALVCLLLAGLLATLLPARRAARVDPAQMLRGD
jgi:putative ABC transport system permease protein